MGKRRRWTAAEKLRIVLAGLDGTIEISDLCRREGVNPTLYYQWKQQLLGSAAKVFEKQRGPQHQRPRGSAEAELTRAKNVIAEITAENLDLKKALSG